MSTEHVKAPHPEAPELGVFVRKLKASVVPANNEKSLPERSQSDIDQAERLSQEEGPILFRRHGSGQHPALFVELLQ